MKLQDYINYYIGCKMIRSSHWEPQNEPYVLDYKNIGEAIEFGDRLVLRRLEDLSDEEWLEMESETSIAPDAIGWYGVRESIMTMETRHRFHWVITNEVLIILRKRGVDVDGLIPAGLAIDAKKITP
jgi:hypothetical protein